MKSMTGYGYAEYACEKYLMTMELKSYNNRYLEVGYNSPAVLSGYENRIKEIISTYAQRGHIDVSVRLKSLKGDVDVSIDAGVAKAYIDAAVKLKALMKEAGLDVPDITASDIMNSEGVITTVSKDGLDSYVEGLESCAATVMQQFDAAKRREGEVTRADLEGKINSIEHSLNVVKQHAGELEELVKKGLMDKIHEMLADQNYDEGRILTEVAVMLVRYTINEEVVRLGAHIAEFKRLLCSDEPVGKRMDFLCQEMNREINTIGSKSQIVEINFEVVNMKDCLENIREQVRNIE